MMQHDSVELQSLAISDQLLSDPLDFRKPEKTNNAVFDSVEPTWFYTRYQDCMEMCADIDTVAQYLDQHQGWFCRCAEPMKTQPIGENAYDLLIGRFGAFGYQVEARVGLELLPPNEQGIYLIHTVPVPNYTPPGYEVNFEATMQLVELPVEEFCQKHKIRASERPSAVIGAQWTLDLYVGVVFPKFIRSMSKSLIEKTGDRLLSKIVKQVSRRLTYKTQMDFHSTLHLPLLNLKK